MGVISFSPSQATPSNGVAKVRCRDADSVVPLLEALEEKVPSSGARRRPTDVSVRVEERQVDPG
jgi:hypothetical protein